MANGGTGAAPRTVQEAAEQVFFLLRGNAKDQRQAALFMDGVLGRWMDNYFRRLGVPEDEAEELTMDVWVKLLAARYEDRGNGFALLCRMRHSRYVEYLRARHADKRSGGSVEGVGGASEVQGDEEFWNVVIDTVAAPAAPEGLEDCVQRKFQLFQQTAPARASLLEMLAEGMRSTDILKHFGVQDYVRAQSRITTQMPSDETARLLKQPATRPLLCVECLDVDMQGTPIKYGETVFCGDRVQLLVNNGDET